MIAYHVMAITGSLLNSIYYVRRWPETRFQKNNQLFPDFILKSQSEASYNSCNVYDSWLLMVALMMQIYNCNTEIVSYE